MADLDDVRADVAAARLQAVPTPSACWFEVLARRFEFGPQFGGQEPDGALDQRPVATVGQPFRDIERREHDRYFITADRTARSNP